MEPDEINRAEKQALDLFLGGDTTAYQAPAQSAEDFVARGLIDESGNATEQGELFLKLRDRGLVQPDGQLTERGLAYGMTEDQSLDPSNLWAFKVRRRDGVDSPDATFGEMVGGVGEFVWDAGAGLINRIGEELKIGTPWEDPNKLNLSGVAMAEGAIKSTEELLGLGQVGAGIVGIPLGNAIGMDEQADNNLWIARQNLARTQKTNRDAAAGTVIQDLTGIKDGVELAATAKASLPPEEYARIVKQGNATGSLVDPTIFIPAGAAAKAGKVGVITRAGVAADRVLAEVAQLDAAIAAKGLEVTAMQGASELATKAADIAMQTSRKGAEAGTLTGKAALETGRVARTGAIMSDTFSKTATLSAQQLAELTARRQSLATRIPEQIAMRTQQAIELGRAAKAVPVQVAGQTLETIGNGLIFLNDGLKEAAEKYGLGTAYDMAKRAAPIGGFAIGGIPGMAAASGAVASGPAVRGAGRFFQVVGKELSNARGQVPFWQRVGNYPDLSAVHRGIARLTDTATMGGALPNAVRGGSRGIAAAYPIDLAFEYLADGGDPNADTFKRAFAQSLVIGGSSGMLGGMFAGTKARHRELALGDELNFRRNANPEQKSYFDSLSPGARRAVATYAAMHPQLRIEFNDGIHSSYSNLTASIGTRSSNPIRPLIAHEVLHHVVVRNQMEDSITALLLGDGESGGLLRSNDGNLSPDFKGFWDAYNARRTAANQPVAGIKEAALEYYIETSADYVSEMAESGELGSIAGRSDVGRSIRKIVQATVAKLPIISDLHFKLGGQIDPDGRLVMGNGLLADGLREHPQIRAMTRQMIRQSSGRAQGNFKVKGVDDMGGVELPTPKKGDPIIDKSIAFFETEQIDGQTRVKKDKDGNAVPLDPELAQERAETGIDVLESLEEQGVKLPEDFKKPERKKRRSKKPREKRPETQEPEFTKATAEKSEEAALPDNVGEVAENGDLVLRGLSDKTLEHLRKKGVLNSEQMRILREVNRAVRNFNGSNYLLINHPALDGRKKYASLEATLRDAVPLDIRITKKGNLTVALMSVTKLKENIDKRIATNRGKKLYNGDREALMNDLNAVMELHHQGKGTQSYFEGKYGNRWEEYKNFCNTVFGLMTSSQKTGKSKTGDVWSANPLFEIDKVGYPDNVFKTYRLDRISQATKAVGDDAVRMPFVYGSVKMNLMPNGLPENP